MSEKPPLALINGPKLPQGNRWAMVYRTRSVLTGWLSASNIADARYWAVADIHLSHLMLHSGVKQAWLCTGNVRF
jgi:hypothetical protein